MTSFIWLTIALPLLGVLINGFYGRQLGRDLNGKIGSGSVGLAFVIGLIIFFSEETAHIVKLWDWISIGEFDIGLSLLVDRLSMIMVLVVTGVGSLIHIYAIGYMDHDKDVSRFFTYLNLFIASMLILVLASNYVVMYVGWELVGVCSYLLIGFWYHKDSAADAGKKAFIVNRIGDFGFALGIFLIWSTFGSLDFLEVFSQLTTESVPAHETAISAITLLLFVGAIGKSAQLPLYVWLPDAMEGPTPVSALIHAATMVTAGVFMMVRNNALYAVSPGTLTVIAYIGALTAIFAASMALVEMDLKRVLAYSTISQLGYMVLAVGVGGYVAAMFHLVTHAFFKALLFMGAGSVMHATHEVIDMRRLGGLRNKMKTTYWTFIVGGAALAGFPLTAGFFSKDKILVTAFESNMLLYLIGIVTALMTAFYTFRAIFMTFHGQPRDKQVYDHIHENSDVMTRPLIVLAVLSILGGLLGLPKEVIGLPNWISGWLHPVLERGETLVHHEGHHLSFSTEVGLLVASAIIALVGIALAFLIYDRNPKIADMLGSRLGVIHKVLFNKYYVDEIYNAIFVEPSKSFSRFLAKAIDVGVIDNILVDGFAKATVAFGGAMSKLQSGYIRNYITTIFVGCLIIGIYFLSR